MSRPGLRVVQEEGRDHDSLAVEAAAASPSMPFDPELDLGAIEDEETDRSAEESRPVQAPGSAFRKWIRLAGLGLGGVVVFLVVLVLYVRGSKPPVNVPPVTAKVDVLESALQEASVAVQSAHDQNPRETTAISENEVSADSADFQPPISLAASAVPVVQPPVSVAQMREEILAVIDELRQFTVTTREGYAEQRAQIAAMREELVLLQSSGETTSLRVEGLAADFAQLRTSLEKLTANKRSQVATLQRQLSAKQRELQTQQAVRQEKPAFVLTSVTLWGSDYLATVTLNGMPRDLGQGDVLDGWKVTAISDSTVTLIRLQDGVSATLGVGR